MFREHGRYRDGLLALFIVLVGLVPRLLAQGGAPAPVPIPVGGLADPVGFLEWAVREGGAFAVIMVILFFYRRDWKQATEFWRDQHSITTKLVQESTAAQVQMAGALSENTRVAHSLKNVLQQYIPARRHGEDRPT